MIDNYSLKARVFPVLIALLPIFILLFGYVFKLGVYWHSLTALGIFGALSFLLSQIGRDFGKRKEPFLFLSWGGKPSSILLRHNSIRLDKTTKERYHRRLETLLSIKLPTKDEEAQGNSEADLLYDSCAKYLISQTRDHSKFGLLLVENINYGFRRNLWGLKPFAILATLTCLLIHIILSYRMNGSWVNFSLIDHIITDLLLILLIFWIFYVKISWVKDAAFDYAERLLETLNNL